VKAPIFDKLAVTLPREITRKGKIGGTFLRASSTQHENDTAAFLGRDGAKKVGW
jgi:hypothetical protein